MPDIYLALLSIQIGAALFYLVVTIGPRLAYKALRRAPPRLSPVQVVRRAGLHLGLDIAIAVSSALLLGYGIAVGDVYNRPVEILLNLLLVLLSARWIAGSWKRFTFEARLTRRVANPTAVPEPPELPADLFKH